MQIEKFDVIGMTCAACEANVTKAVNKLDGVKSAEVSLLSNSMKVEYDPSKVDPQKIENAVSNIGYSAVLQNQKLNEEDNDLAAKWEKKQEKVRQEMKEKKKILVISLILLAVLMCFSMLPMFGIFTFFMDMEWMMVSSIMQLVLSMIILFYQRSFFTHGFKALIKKAPNMDTLVAIGSSVSFLYGLYGILRMAYGYGVMDHHIIHSAMDALYFESAAMIVTLVSLGKYLEARSKAKTSDALGKLADLSPKSAVIEKDGVEIQVEASQVTTGDLVVVRPGQKIPVDGIVETGTGYVDQAAITGESVPVERVQGDPVMAATININGTFKFTATKVGDDTTLAQVIRLVNEAGNSKAPIARLADKVAGIFVPAVLVIALVTFIGWMIASMPFEFALSNAVSVLVISCPCALGLATPLAIMVSTGKAAEYGVLIKSASALETLHNVKAIVLDKTGTITSGKPEVVDVRIFDSALNPDQFIEASARAEMGSEHPLGKAVVQYALAKNLSLSAPESFEAISGRGLLAKVDSWNILAGNKAFMDENYIQISPEEIDALNECASKGQTPLLFAFNNQLAGLIAIADTVRPDSASALKELKKMGIRTIMLTGDNAATANAIARNLDIDEVISDVLPADKESVIRKLQDQKEVCAMVGDGINDAPALTRADVGIAIGAGTDIAIESADIVLMKDSLLDVVSAVQLSRATIRNIKENLFWAFFYNVLGIPVAMGLFYPAFGWLLNPMIGAAAMSLSSVTVCLNALRLRLFKPTVASVRVNGQEVKPEVPVVTISEIHSEEEKIQEIPELLNEQAKDDERNSALIQISNMTCNHCAGRIKQTLEEFPFVKTAEVSLKNNEAFVLMNPAENENQKKERLVSLLAALDEAGYPGKVLDKNTDSLTKTYTFDVAGMSCAHCVNRVEQALKSLPGIKNVDVDLNKNQARVTLEKKDSSNDQEMISQCIQAIKEAGYEAVLKEDDEDKTAVLKPQDDQTILLNVDGMSCAHCTASVTKALESVPGVVSVQVSLEKKQAVVIVRANNSQAADVNTLIEAVKEAGYGASEIKSRKLSLQMAKK
ncbi:heavy metal translocating P-type ATPase [Ileibacterium valens]|uniref:Copper-exporting P-type ATPase n=1 Tax=Ileibacterium valens TaxID=1862668 RepID=A0A1U7NHS4_9FIRM|nr:heavy metal translocating P-type ATPase [Ileibacterium valens]OLU39334.1 copper-translocating P-type ATPase [Erysipelotrichaceae bacterium NYU-BL-E8]OLU41479.1 copper-translocating P-type ATPase [Erysipelotrichaceae bacterium NYU-BL-F16]OLU41579.1 copper-translocating P-type ATPase [Ileibacterium valens]